jgi:hypothetical protein
MVGSPDSRGAYHKEVDTLHKLFPQKPKVVIYQIVYHSFAQYCILAYNRTYV